MAFYEKSRVRIHCRETGSGRPPLVIPGGGQDATIGLMSDRAPFVMPDETPLHPDEPAVESAMLAPKSDLTANRQA